MSKPLPKRQVEFISGRGAFCSIICKECKCYPMQHWCLFKVCNGGYLFDCHQVCGIAVCSICSSSFGNEGVFTCAKHSNPQETERPIPKENVHPETTSKWTTRSNKTFSPVVMAYWKADAANWKVNEDKKKKEQGAEYSATENLLLSKAWISASENSIVGVHKKMKTFWDSVLQYSNVFKRQHDECTVWEGRRIALGWEISAMRWAKQLSWKRLVQ